MSELVDGAVERIGNVVRGFITLAKVARAVASAARHVALDISEPEADATQHWQPYGFAAAPLPGSFAVQVAIGAQQDKLVTILVHDIRHRPALVAGEVCLHDDQAQSVAVKRAGVVVTAPSIKLGAGATLAAARVSDPVLVQDTIWQTWLDSVGAATFVGPAPLLAPIGNISSGSAKTVIE